MGNIWLHGFLERFEETSPITPSESWGAPHVGCYLSVGGAFVVYVFLRVAGHFLNHHFVKQKKTYVGSHMFECGAAEASDVTKDRNGCIQTTTGRQGPSPGHSPQPIPRSNFYVSRRVVFYVSRRPSGAPPATLPGQGRPRL